MYAPAIDSATLYQGDVLSEFPFFMYEDIDLDELISNQEAVLAVKSKLNKAILLSQTCDAQRRSHVLIAPVFELSEKLTDLTEPQQNALIDSVKKRKINYWFYLPEKEGVINESIADFQLIHYIPREIVEKFQDKKVLMLSDWGRHHLGWELSKYFGRPIESKN